MAWSTKEKDFHTESHGLARAPRRILRRRRVEGPAVVGRAVAYM